MSDLTLDSLLSSLSDSPAETQIEKAASEQVSVADDLKNMLTKEASASNSTGEENMTAETGNAIADSILSMLEKSAGVHGDGGGNKVVSDLDTMVEQHTQRIEQTPRQGKTITETAKAMMNRDGGEQLDKVDGAEASPEGNEGSNVPAKPSDIEKAAAVNELMAEGVDFEDAVELVKQASDELEAEEYELEKVAAVNELMEEGVAFEDAVELVKQAEEEMFEEELELEKVAAVNELMEEGIDFEDAVELVKQASDEMYGYEEDYSDMEKAAATYELMEEDGLSFEEASELVKEAAAAPALAPQHENKMFRGGQTKANKRAQRLAQAKRGAKKAGKAGAIAAGAIAAGAAAKRGVSEMKKDYMSKKAAAAPALAPQHENKMFRGGQAAANKKAQRIAQLKKGGKAAAKFAGKGAAVAGAGYAVGRGARAMYEDRKGK